MRPSGSPIAILCGIPDERRPFAEAMANPTEAKIQGLSCLTGDLAGRPCILVDMGMGKTDAAMATTLVLGHFQPRMVLCAGIAGGLNPDLAWGDTIIVEKTVHHDYGRLDSSGMTRWPTFNPLSRDHNPLYLPTDPTLVDLARTAAAGIELPPVNISAAERSPHILKGVLATGDVFAVAPELRRELWQALKADIVDMEGAAVVQVAHQLGIPSLVIRSISDIGDDDTEQGAAWDDVVPAAAQNAAHLVMATLATLET